MSRVDQVIALRTALWRDFEALVRQGAVFPQLLDVCYPPGINLPGLSRTTDGRSWFYATRLLANPGYTLLLGEDLIVAAGMVVFVDTDLKEHRLEPEITDLLWLAMVLDEAG